MANEDDKLLKILTGEQRAESTDDDEAHLLQELGDSMRKVYRTTLGELNEQPAEQDREDLDKMMSYLRDQGLVASEERKSDEAGSGILETLVDNVKSMFSFPVNHVESAFASDGDVMKSNQELYELVVNGKVQVSIQVNVDSRDKNLATIVAHFSKEWMENPETNVDLDKEVSILAQDKVVLKGKIIDGEISAVVTNYTELPLTQQWMVVGATHEKK